MQRLKFNITSGRLATLVDKASRLGWVNASTVTVAVKDVPDDADARVIASQLTKTNIPQRVFEIEHSRPGKNLMRTDNLNDRQWEDSPNWFQKQFPKCQKTV